MDSSLLELLLWPASALLDPFLLEFFLLELFLLESFLLELFLLESFLLELFLLESFLLELFLLESFLSGFERAFLCRCPPFCCRHSQPAWKRRAIPP